MRQHLREIFCVNSRPLEFILAIQAIVYGGWLLLPFETFNTASFTVMRSIAPEEAWGGIIFAVGIIQFFGLFTERIVARRVLGFLDLFLWTAVDLALWASRSTAIAPIFILTSVVASIIVVISLALGDCRE